MSKYLFIQCVTCFISLLFQVNTSQECPNYWKEYGNSCYLFLTPGRSEVMSWEASRSNCKRYGADLVSILNSSEADFIYRQTSSLVSDGFWIGLRKNKTTSDPKKGWAWSDGSNFTNPEQWEVDEPKNEDENKYCAQVYSQDRKWNSEDCGFLASSICKRKKGNVFIVRVRFS